MGRLGFEPRTNRLKAECSTAELATRVRLRKFYQTQLTSITEGSRVWVENNFLLRVILAKEFQKAIPSPNTLIRLKTASVFKAVTPCACFAILGASSQELILLGNVVNISPIN